MKKLRKSQIKWIEKTVANSRRYKAVFYNRVLFCILLLIFQVVGFFLLVDLLGRYGVFLQLFVSFFAVLFVLHLISRTDAPPSKAAWIILILSIPVLGIVAYLFYGNGWSTKRILKCYEKSKSELPAPKNENRYIPCDIRREALCKVLEKEGFPVYKGQVTYFKTGEQLFESMCEAIEKAEKFILIEYFIIAGGEAWGRMLKLLLTKAEQGVKVKIVYDDFGSVFVLPLKYDRYLEGLHENIECLCFNKINPIFTLQMNHRDHRKMLVVDGVVAYTGGLNIADEYIDKKRRFGYWKDTGVRVTGGAVASFTRAFFGLWKTFKDENASLDGYFPALEGEVETGFVQPYDDCPLDRERVGEGVYLDLIERAEKRLYITTPYLLLDDLLRSALIRAAKRGVDIRIVTPAIPDKKTVYALTRANYEALLKVGVKIYEYTPGFIHAKSVLADDCAVVGTINFDFRSLYHHFENAVYFSTTSAILALLEDFEETFSVSKEQTLSMQKRNPFYRIFVSLLRLIEPLL